MSEENTQKSHHDWGKIILDMCILMVIVGFIGVASKEGMALFERKSPSEDLISIVGKNQMEGATNPAFLKEIEAGEDRDANFINLADGNGVTPLMWMCYANFNDSLKDLETDQKRLYYVNYLLSRPELNKGAADKDGFTALHWAAWSGLPGCVELLLQAGLDINQPENNGFTPLMLAASRGNVAVVAELLQMGAKTDLVNKAGKTAAQLAEEKYQSYRKSDHVFYSLIYSEHRDFGHELTSIMLNQGMDAVKAKMQSPEAADFRELITLP